MDEKTKAYADGWKDGWNSLQELVDEHFKEYMLISEPEWEKIKNKVEKKE